MERNDWMLSNCNAVVDGVGTRYYELMERRKFLTSVGAITAASIAGCTNDDSPPVPTDSPNDEATDQPTETPIEGDSPAGSSIVSSDVKQRMETFLNSDPAASNYDGTIKDQTGKSEVTIKVGAQGNDGNFAFEPAAVAIDLGARIVWEWTGKGDPHNVISVEDSELSFGSGEPVSGEGETFTKTFSESGVGLYECEPHATLGMKGAFALIK